MHTRTYFIGTVSSGSSETGTYSTTPSIDREKSTGLSIYISVILSVGGLLVFVTAVLLFPICRKKRRASAVTAKN
jgi:hypothetical protein